MEWASTNQQFVAAYYIPSKSVEKIVRHDWVHTFLISHTTVASHDGQYHPNWYQILSLEISYHHTKFERNYFLNAQMQANIFVFFDEIT